VAWGKLEGANAARLTKVALPGLQPHHLSNAGCGSNLQIPIGTEDSLKGLIDLVHRQAFMFEGSSGEKVVGESPEWASYRRFGSLLPCIQPLACMWQQLSCCHQAARAPPQRGNAVAKLLILLP